MKKFRIAFFYIAVSAFLFSCDINSETENASGKLNTDSVQSNETVRVDTNKYVLKSSEAEAVLDWPRINGSLPKKVLDKMNRIISIDSICMESIQEIQSNYEKCACGTVGSGFSVNFNKHNLLSLSISVETMGAYPDGYLKSFNFNTRTGSLVYLDSLIKKDSMASLVSRLNSELKKRMEEANAIAEEDAEKPEEGDSMETLFERTEFSKEDLKSFTITEKGINFYFDFGFPHAFQSLEPAGDFFISKEELKKYLKEDVQL